MSPIPINPLVDFAFKKLLGDPATTDILIDFLNAILRLSPPITRVEIQNPFNPQDLSADKLTVVDVKASDDQGRRYQVEVQLQVHAALPARVLYSWARTHAEQIHKGESYQDIRPTLAIWVLDGLLFPGSSQVHHRFRLVDSAAGLHLTDHLELHVLQLPRFEPSPALDEEGRWVYFLKEARHWTELPASLDAPALRRAMDKLDDIRRSEADRARYLAREDYFYLQATLERARRETLQELEQAQEQLGQANEQLGQANEQLGQANEQLGQAQEQLGQAQQDLELTQEQLRQADVARQRAEAVVEEERARATARLDEARADQERLRARMRAAGLDPDA
ncbi:Rpn family recombination-promoting nuclease/putative transposase [Myxococcota bacterium]|nr:Rpn family recombination-promoting nuclease/putative transposase [Myxococcota bacterium]